MGNLHAGHLKLVMKPEKGDRVGQYFCQFDPVWWGEDFETYPRTEREDQQNSDAFGADLFSNRLFQRFMRRMPNSGVGTGLSEYIAARQAGTFLTELQQSSASYSIWCNRMSPYIRVKDFQQLTVIRTMVRDLNIPVEIIGVETVREASGWQ
jgi:pantoate--beta-alanine ligase